MHRNRRFAPRLNARRGSVAPERVEDRRAECAALLLRPDVQRALHEHDVPLLLLDRDRVRQAHLRVQASMPSVRLHYAVHAPVRRAAVDALASADGCFAVDSDDGLTTLRAAGVAPERTIHTHPVKSPEQIRNAFELGIRVFVIDHVCELLKFDRYGDAVRLLVRLHAHADDSAAAAQSRFGVGPVAAAALVAAALARGIRVAGFCFEPDQPMHPESLRARLIDTLTLMDDLEAHLPVRFESLHMGGLGLDDASLTGVRAIADAIRPVLALRARDLDITASPGAGVLTAGLAFVSVAPDEDDAWMPRVGAADRYVATPVDGGALPCDTIVPLDGADAAPVNAELSERDLFDVASEAIHSPVDQPVRVSDSLPGQVVDAP
jgi:Diaminopimelate decarboxylase